MRTTKTAGETLQTVFGTSTRHAVANILAVWGRATEADRDSGSLWYATARHHAELMSESSGVTLEAATAVIAHLSPRTTWARNLAGAYALVETGTAPNCIGANVDRARAALDSDDPIGTLHGPKTHAFALNILGDQQAVTVDVWAARIALGTDATDNQMKRAGAYAALAHCYRLAAQRAGVTPATMQAVTWVVSRNGRSE